MSKRIALIVCLVASAAVVNITPGEARGATCTLYASEASDLGRDFWVLDPETADGDVVGDMGGEITGIAVHPVTGVLYGVTAAIQLGMSEFDPGDLVTIDPRTGDATLVGSLGLADLSDEGPTLADIAFDPATGILYGWRAGNEGDLYTVNLDTGAATLVGESGLTDLSGNGLTFGPQNRLFFAGEETDGLLRTIDKATGMSIGSVQLSGYQGTGKIGALAFDGDSLFGILTDDDVLITINPFTGVITEVDETESDALDGLAFVCSAPAPAMNQVVMACLGLGLLLSGLVGLRLRARKAVS